MEDENRITSQTLANYNQESQSELHLGMNTHRKSSFVEYIVHMYNVINKRLRCDEENLHLKKKIDGIEGVILDSGMKRRVAK